MNLQSNGVKLFRFLVFIKTPYHIRYCFSELSPVCAIVGGIFAQEVIKVIKSHSVRVQMVTVLSILGDIRKRRTNQ